jgi:hypothetical protein
VKDEVRQWLFAGHHQGDRTRRNNPEDNRLLKNLICWTTSTFRLETFCDKFHSIYFEMFVLIFVGIAKTQNKIIWLWAGAEHSC